MKTIIDSRYDPSSFETEIYNNSLVNFKVNLSKNNKDYFAILMPPPNVTGSLHLGHALTYTLQDILVRYNRQRVKDTYWQPGLDHAGISTQLVVQKWLEENGVNYKDLTNEEFIAKVWEWKNQSSNNIVFQQKALGCSAPWEYSRFTMDEGFIKSVIEAFVRLYKDGLIYKDNRLVNWDTKLETAISDLEIKNVEENGTLWYINYKLENKDKYITVATTRPETMFGDVALAVNADDNRYKDLIGQYAYIPYTNRKIPIISDEHADMEKGSGCVKITPAHDFNDFEVGKRHNLDSIVILDKHGHLLNNDFIPEFIRGLFLKKARKLLLEKLRSDGLLVKEESIKHFVPYGDKSGTVIEPMITEQWFLNVKGLSKQAIEAVKTGKIKFYPDKWKNTFFDWMNNIQPWCISRQIKWGHRIPAWYGPNGEIIVARNEEEAIIEAEKLCIDKSKLTRESDVLDTWFSSSLWPFATMGWPEKTELLDKYFPTSTIITGFDIIFFWISRMIMMSLYFMNDIPFRDIYIHALVRDNNGQKMSKSKGNVINPLDLMNEFGTDALRYTLVFLSVPGRDIKFGRENVKISRNFITKIWNACRFLQTQDVNFNVDISDIKLVHPIHHWIFSKLKEFKNGIDSDINEYRFDYIAHRMQVFLRDQFCDFFVEAIKLQNDENTKNIAGIIYKEFLKLSNPIIPFVTEYLLKVVDNNYSLSLINIDNIIIDNNNVDKINNIVDWIHNVRSIKHEFGKDSKEYITACNNVPNFGDDCNVLIKLAF